MVEFFPKMGENKEQPSLGLVTDLSIYPLPTSFRKGIKVAYKNRLNTNKHQ